MKKGILFLAGLMVLGTAAVFNDTVSAHCEIPCGIYNDAARFSQMEEDARTVEKSVKMINDLSADSSKNINQLVRWVQNKDEHADKIKTALAQYFLSQRIKKPESEKGADWKQYQEELVLLHTVTVAAMKAKQNDDLKYAKNLHQAIAEFRKAYEDNHGHK